METTLATIKTKTAELSTLSTIDLGVQDKVDALVKTAHEVNEQSKALKEQDTLVKTEFKRMCKPYTDEGHSVTCYSYSQEKKMTIVLSGGGMEIDEKKLLEKIYEMYGETVGDKGGRAWAAYCAISDPMEAPRQLNPDKLAAEIARAERITSGIEDGDITVTGSMVKEATTEKKPSIVAKCSNMTKSEIKEHQMGNLTDTLVVK